MCMSNRYNMDFWEHLMEMMTELKYECIRAPEKEWEEINEKRQMKLAGETRQIAFVHARMCAFRRERNTVEVWALLPPQIFQILGERVFLYEDRSKQQKYSVRTPYVS